MKQKIFLDAGHNYSNFNTGAIGNGMREQDITFHVANVLGEKLKKHFDVKLSRPTLKTNLGHDNNSAVNARFKMANQWGADYFLSIHANAGGGTGAEVFINNEKSRDFASILNNYCKITNMRNRGIKRANFAVITHTKMPSALFELAFLDSPNNEDINLLRNISKMADALYQSILIFFNISVDNKEDEMRYNRVEDMPDWALETIEKLVNLGFLQGDGNNLNLTEEMLRLLVINDRAGLYN